MILRAGGHVVTLAPEVGGSVAAWTWHGRDVLRPAAAGEADVLGMGCFPMLPFPNRVRDGRFVFEGARVALAPNMGDHRHAIHGQGWLAAWEVAEAAEDRAVLRFEHAAGDWPWDYSAALTYRLDAGGLWMEVAVTGRDSRPMPVGLGVHPYFVRHPDTELLAATSGWWEHDDEIMPTRFRAEAAADLTPWLHGGALVDHVFAGFGGEAELRGGGMRLGISAPGAGWLVVYAPVAEDFVCVEPVTQPTDALNDPVLAGVRVVFPGETQRLAVRVAVGAG
jgi:aldose 1-epimerase